MSDHSDYPYALAYFPDEPAQHVARLATYYRLLQHAKGKKTPLPQSREDWGRLLGYVLGLWRQRAALYSRRGAGVSPCRLAYARNCPPCGLGIRGAPAGATALPCREAVCPWCAGRTAAAVYHACRTLYQPGDGLCRILGSQLLPPRSVAQLALHLRRQRELLHDLTAVHKEDLRGSYWSVAVEPAQTRYDRTRSFRVLLRWLALFKPGCSLRFRPLGPAWRLGFLGYPEEKDFQRAVAGVCSYPAGLLRGPVEEALTILRARADLRLSERSGVFRGFNGELPETSLAGD